MYVPSGVRSILFWPLAAYEYPDVVPLASVALFYYLAQNDLPANPLLTYLMLGITYTASSTRQHVHLEE